MTLATDIKSMKVGRGQQQHSLACTRNILKWILPMTLSSPLEGLLKKVIVEISHILYKVALLPEPS